RRQHLQPVAPLPCTINSRPPTPPLCPYTTLFRSPVPGGEVRPRSVVVGAVRSVVEVAGGGPVGQLGGGGDVLLAEPGRPGIAHRDRKSTRLNSSHVSISYAGFCLNHKNEATDNSI